MVSDHLPRNMVWGCDDDGIYYARQLDAEDGVEEFDGIVWFGQEFTDEPTFANVYMGRLRRGVREDENGERVDRWEGRYFDVPKGRVCNRDDLTLKSLVVPPSDRAGCDFAERYIVRVGRSGFGGGTWPIESTITGCWDHVAPVDGESPPPVPPVIGRAISSGSLSIREEVVELRSDSVPAGFEHEPEESLTGTWQGDDGGTYYVTHAPDTNDVVWYAESPDARPATPDESARGWSNVFFGSRDDDTIEGMWADVPRGGTRNAGELALDVENPWFMRIDRATGGYGGRRLWRVQTLDVEVEVPELTIEDRQEDADEPLLYLVFFKLDGDTVDLDELSSSSATIEVQPEIGLGRNVTGTVMVPADRGSYSTTLSTVRSSSGDRDDVEDATRIGAIAYAIEVDSGYSDEFRERRYSAWVRAQQWTLNSRLRRGELPTTEFIRSRANRILVKYLGPWEGWPWGDPDDVLSGDAEVATFAELRRAADAGTGPIERTLEFAGDAARYTAPVVFRATSRVNPDCSP